MKGVNGCPDCAGSGLVGGFQVPCSTLNFRNLTEEPLTTEEIEAFWKTQKVPQNIEELCRRSARLLVQAVLRTNP